MNELTRKLTPLQEIEVANELERLFILQDRQLSDAKKETFVRELSQSGLPFKAIITGIKRLADEDCKQIKLISILKASEVHTIFKEPEGCDKCFRTGFVTMTNEAGYSFAYACSCEKGEFFAKNQEAKRWNGKRQMYSQHFGLMTLSWQYDNDSIQNIPDEEYQPI